VRGRSSCAVLQRLASASDSRFHTAAKAGTTGCARACRRACDSPPRGHSRSVVWCLARRRCALATRCRKWSVQRPSITISTRNGRRSIGNANHPVEARDPGVLHDLVSAPDPPASFVMTIALANRQSSRAGRGIFSRLTIHCGWSLFNFEHWERMFLCRVSL
jgi:hypothetical protein